MHGSLYIIQNVNIFSKNFFILLEKKMYYSKFKGFFFILLHEHLIIHPGSTKVMPSCCRSVFTKVDGIKRNLPWWKEVYMDIISFDLLISLNIHVTPYSTGYTIK